MTDKYALYRVLAPFRVKRQKVLREARLGVTLQEFQSEIGAGDLKNAAAEYLWERLREIAFVPDFRPSASDDLGETFALSPDSVRDELVEGLVDHLGINTEHIDFSGFSFTSIENPRDIVDFVQKVASLDGQPPGTRFVRTIP